MPLFRALAKNMAPMTNADESPTNRLTLFPIYLSLFIVSTLCLYCICKDISDSIKMRTHITIYFPQDDEISVKKKSAPSKSELVCTNYSLFNISQILTRAACAAQT